MGNGYGARRGVSNRRGGNDETRMTNDERKPRDVRIGFRGTGVNRPRPPSLSEEVLAVVLERGEPSPEGDRERAGEAD